MTTKRETLATTIAGMITLGEYPAEERLPSEADLCRKFDVSRITVRGALQALANDGLVESVKGSGWYVRGDHRLRYPLLDFDANRHVASADVWNAWIKSLEKTGSNRLRVAIEVPPPDVQRTLRLEPGDKCVVRHRVRLVDGNPWAISVAYWPMWLAEGTELERTGEGPEVDMQDPSPLKFAAQRGYPSLRDEHVIGSRMPSDEEAATLVTGRGVPLITMSTISTTIRDRPLRRTDDLYPAHRFLLVVSHDREEKP